MYDLQEEFGDDWIVRFSVQNDAGWLTAEKDDGSQRLEAPTADVLRKAVGLLNEKRRPPHLTPASTACPGRARGKASAHDHANRRQDGRQRYSVLAIGVPLLVVGSVLALLLDGTARGIGLAVAVLGAIPIVVGIVLLASAGIERRSRKGKPYA